VGTTLQLPESYEKSQNKEIFHFLWVGQSEKEKRTLCFKKQMNGGLAIPHIPSRLAAIKCSWIKRLKDKPGIFQLAFENKGIDWSLEASYKTPFPCFTDATECINEWSKSLYLTQVEQTGLLWPWLNDPLRKTVQRRQLGMTILDATTGDWTGFNFLEQRGISGATARLSQSLEET
jgi:hypothetical protein